MGVEGSQHDFTQISHSEQQLINKSDQSPPTSSGTLIPSNGAKRIESSECDDNEYSDQDNHTCEKAKEQEAYKVQPRLVGPDRTSYDTFTCKSNCSIWSLLAWY